VLDAIRRTGALDYARAAARSEAATACEAIRRVHDSNYRQSLLDLAVFAVERTH
jgi:octaprenyl-diphosphate synthase